MSLRRRWDLCVYEADCSCGTIWRHTDSSQENARDAFVAEGWAFPPVEGGVARSVCPVCVGVAV